MKKIKLEQVSVRSFVTQVQNEDQIRVAGGVSVACPTGPKFCQTEIQWCGIILSVNYCN